jgi:heat shock protein HtpX
MIREKIRFHKLGHLFRTALIMGAMGTLPVLTGWIIAGWTGAKFALALAAISFILSPRLSFHFHLTSKGARRLGPGQAPRLFEITRRLSERAGLARVPDLYILPGNVMNAFAVGEGNRAAVGLTHGLLRRLDTREIAGIIGHEITHIKNNDTGIMGLAGLVNRLTGYLSLLGQFLMILFVPTVLLDRTRVSLAAIFIWCERLPSASCPGIRGDMGRTPYKKSVFRGSGTLLPL